MAYAPETQFAATQDGVEIAYWTLGQGPVLIQLPGLPHSHIEMEWGIPEWRLGYELTASDRTVVRYDAKGTGRSQRDDADFWLDSMLLDLDAVVQSLDVDSVSLYATVNSCPIALAYAAEHPERVSRLVLWEPVVDTSIHLSTPMLEAARRIVETDWRTFSETIAHSLFDWSQPASARRYAELIRAGVDQHQLLRLGDQMHTYDVRMLLPDVTCPTLLLHREESPIVPMEMVEEIRAGLVDARLVVFEGSAVSTDVGDWRSILGTSLDFLAEQGSPADHNQPSEGRAHRRFRMKTDTLSDRERDVSRLVARGLTNKEIAAELHLADKTVEHHVSRILNKLDLRSRTQLAVHVTKTSLNLDTGE